MDLIEQLKSFIITGKIPSELSDAMGKSQSLNEIVTLLKNEQDTAGHLSRGELTVTGSENSFTLSSLETIKDRLLQISKKAAELRKGDLDTRMEGDSGYATVFNSLAETISELTETLNSQNAKYRLLEKYASDVIWMMDMNFLFTYVSPSVEKLRGFTQEEVLNQTINESLIPESLEVAMQAFHRAEEMLARGERPQSETFKLGQPCKDGSVVWTETSINLVLDDQGNVVNILGVTRDDTDRHQAEMLIQEQKTIADALIEIAAVLNSSLDLEKVLDTILLNVGRVVPYHAIDIMLMEENQKYAKPVRGAGYENMDPNFSHSDIEFPFEIRNTANLQEMYTTRKPCLISNVNEYEWVSIPETKWIQSALGAPIINRGKVIGFLSLTHAQAGYYQQIHADRLTMFATQIAIAIENAKLFEKIQIQATTDKLTGLVNRHQLEASGEIEFHRAKRYDRQIAVIMFDLDHFKNVNDRFGHTAGDEVLKEIGQYCMNSSRAIDIVARYGGEEFLILLPETDSRKAKVIAERIRSHLEEMRVYHDDDVISITASFGITEITPATLSLRDLIDNADQALYQAKENGRNRVEVFIPNS